jgi:hypothetical protein
MHAIRILVLSIAHVEIYLEENVYWALMRVASTEGGEPVKMP